MKKMISLISLIVLCAALLAGCQCEHQWLDATCALPMTCSLCGEVSGEPLGHSYESKVVEPTEFEEGYTIHTCRVCNDSYVDSQIPALGYHIMEGDLIFKPDGVAYLYGSGGVKETFTGWMDEVYKIEDDYEISAGGFLVTSPWYLRDDIYRVIIEDGVSPASTAYWFYSCYELRSIHIGADVELLGECMFTQCDSLSQISISSRSRMKSIEAWAFSETPTIANFSVPSGITHLGDLPDTQSPIVLNEGLVSIGEHVLTGSDVLIPSTVTAIGKGNLQHMTLPADHPHFKVVDNCLIQTDTKTLVDVQDGFILPTDGSITAIGDAALQGAQLSTIEIPEGVTTIGKQAFYYCKAQTITLPDSVTQIGAEAFCACENLTGIKLPAGLTEIPDDAFRSCEALEEVVIPDGVTSIGKSAFSSCYNLTTGVLPEGLSTIGNNAFAVCSSLQELVLPESLTTIGDDAFGACDALRSVNIPAGVTQIGSNPFYMCSALTELTVAQENPEFYIAGNCLIGRSSKTVIVGIGNAVIPDDGSIEIIGDNAFDSNMSITDMVIPEGVTTIGYSALRGCHNLTRLVLPTTLKSYDDVCFDDCPQLAYIDYLGTMDQWRKVSKGGYQWMSGENIYQIRCTDGILSPWG